MREARVESIEEQIESIARETYELMIDVAKTVTPQLPNRHEIDPYTFAMQISNLVKEIAKGTFTEDWVLTGARMVRGMNPFQQDVAMARNDYFKKKLSQNGMPEKDIEQLVNSPLLWRKLERPTEQIFLNILRAISENRARIVNGKLETEANKKYVETFETIKQIADPARRAQAALEFFTETSDLIDLVCGEYREQHEMLDKMWGYEGALWINEAWRKYKAPIDLMGVDLEAHGIGGNDIIFEDADLRCSILPREFNPSVLKNAKLDGSGRLGKSVTIDVSGWRIEGVICRAIEGKWRFVPPVDNCDFAGCSCSDIEFQSHVFNSQFNNVIIHNLRIGETIAECSLRGAYIGKLELWGSNCELSNIDLRDAEIREVDMRIFNIAMSNITISSKTRIPEPLMSLIRSSPGLRIAELLD